LVVFASITLVAATVILMLRDLVFGERGRAQPPQEDDRSVLPPLELDPEAAEQEQGPAYRWFSRLVLESGFETTAGAALLLALAVGLLLGGGVYFWRDDPISGAVGGLFGALAVLVFFINARARRQWAIQEQLPEVVDFFARAVRSGLSVDQGVELVGHSMFQPLSREFRRCARQLAMGLSLDAAMRTLTRRVPLPETRIFATALRVQRQTGGNLPAVMERLARVFRDRLNYYRQFRASTATVRASLALLIAIAAVVDVYILIGRPEYLRAMMHTPRGWGLLGTSLALQVVGVLWAYLTLKSDY
jgi:tight adherence protein B